MPLILAMHALPETHIMINLITSENQAFRPKMVSGFIFPTQLSHEKKKLITFHYNGWLIGILVLAYYNPHIIG